MRRPAVAALAAAIGVAFSTLALAEPMTKAEYQAARKIIDSDYKGAKVGCEPMTANVIRYARPRSLCASLRSRTRAIVRSRREPAFVTVASSTATGQA